MTEQRGMLMMLMMMECFENNSNAVAREMIICIGQGEDLDREEVAQKGVSPQLESSLTLEEVA